MMYNSLYIIIAMVCCLYTLIISKTKNIFRYIYLIDYYTNRKKPRRPRRHTRPRVGERGGRPAVRDSGRMPDVARVARTLALLRPVAWQRGGEKGRVQS
jgi:hypothetical protein